MDIQAMRALGKAGIVEKAVEQVRRRKPDYALDAGRRDYCRVHAGKRTIKVVLQPVFLVSPYGGGEVVKEDLDVQFTEGSVSIQPDDFVKGARSLDEEARRMLGEVLKSKVPQAGERLTIGMKDGAVEVQVSRGYLGGTERYRIDPQTGEWGMLWHEHPMPPMKMGPVVQKEKDGTWVELEEEVFEEIR